MRDIFAGFTEEQQDEFILIANVMEKIHQDNWNEVDWMTLLEKVKVSPTVQDIDHKQIDICVNVFRLSR